MSSKKKNKNNNQMKLQQLVTPTEESVEEIVVPKEVKELDMNPPVDENGDTEEGMEPVVEIAVPTYKESEEAPSDDEVIEEANPAPIEKEAPIIDGSDNVGDKEDDVPEVEIEEESVDTEDDEIGADPLPERDGNWYCLITNGMNKIDIVEERLMPLCEKLDKSYTQTPQGMVVVGPCINEEEAIKLKKAILGSGLKATTIELD